MRDLEARRGFTLVELLVVIAIVAILIALLLPAIQAAREAGRRATCRSNMHQLGVALQSYHDANGRFPPGALATGPGGVPAGVLNNYRKNWIIHLMPFMELQSLYDSVDWKQLPSIQGGLTNYTAGGGVTYNAFTSTELPSLLCPSDPFNQTKWRVDRSGWGGVGPAPPPTAYQSYGRLNYGANACLMPPFYYPPTPTNPNATGNNAIPCGGLNMEGWTLAVPHSWMTRGVMGWGTSLSIRQITDGTSTTVAVWEIRAGLNESDFRGSWADGRPAASTVWFHLFGPNVCVATGPYADDIQSEWNVVKSSLGANWIAIEMAECMFMTSSGSGPAQGMPRSKHMGGEYGLFCDGSVRFVSDLVEHGTMTYLYSDFTSPWEGNPARMKTWECLNASGDGLPVEEDKLDP